MCRGHYARGRADVSQEPGGDFASCLVAWRTTQLRDRQVVDALVHPAHAAPSPELSRHLAGWPGSAYWSDEADGRHVVLTRRWPRAPERWALHAALLIATLFTTTYAGAILAGTIQPGHLLGLFTELAPTRDALRAWAAGLRFSLPLVAILLAHELGHYLTARRYGLDASPPYFIPVPLWPSFIGTMGAFIRLRTVLSDRRQLLDVGAAGPFAGFVIALPVLALGLARSEPVPAVVGLEGMVIWFGALPVELGDSLVTLALRRLVGSGGAAIALDPLAFAGWVGMMVTMLNLLPIGQLDGGHVLYAALPRWHRPLAAGSWGLLLVLGWFGWTGWAVWAVLVLALSRGRLDHPPVLDRIRPLPRSRPAVALGALLLFAITFAPVPFRI